MQVYLPPSLRHFDKNFKILSSWIDHVPFGYDLVESLRPEITVELGTHEGLSFYTFCQSIIDHHIDGVCYAVDTWEGEQHAGKYDDSVFLKVRDFCRENYPGCSYLMRMYFEEAKNHFDSETVDLIHIDGLHTYDAARQDYEAWYPKLKKGGVMLFHDITARRDDFGVWRLWSELEANDDVDTFHFKHGYGLGVVRKRGVELSQKSCLLNIMFNGSAEDQEMLRAFYVMAAKYNTVKHRAASVTLNKLKK